MSLWICLKAVLLQTGLMLLWIWLTAFAPLLSDQTKEPQAPIAPAQGAWMARAAFTEITRACKPKPSRAKPLPESMSTVLGITELA